MQRECQRPDGVCLTNKYICGLVTPLLYRTAGYQFGKHLAPPETILHHPHLAQHIHQYVLEQRINVRHAPAHIQVLCPENAAYAKLVNLKKLHITIYRGQLESMLSDAPFQLDTLVWDDFAESPLSSAKFCETFLVKQTRIRRLKIDFGLKIPPIQLPSCRNLEYLESDFPGLQALMPARKVASLVWLVRGVDCHIRPRSLDCLAQVFGHLTVLAFAEVSINVIDFPDAIIAHLTEHLGQLKYLQIPLQVSARIS